MTTTPNLPPTVKRGRYLARKLPDHPLANAQGFVLEHRRVAWEHYGQFDPQLQVHHINHDTHDNRPENLEVISIGDHQREHFTKIHNWDEMVAEYAAGATTVQLAEKYDLNPATLSRGFRQRGVQMRRKGYHEPMQLDREKAIATAPSNWEQIAADYATGLTLDQTARKHHTSSIAVRKAVLKSGGELRKKGPQRLERRWRRDELVAVYKVAGSVEGMRRILGISKSFAWSLVEEYNLADDLS